MQFFILFTGVMVFVFYQFESAPLNFNPKAILTVKESKQIEEFSKLEIENLETQKQIRNLLLNNGSSKEIDAFKKKESKQRDVARHIISKSDPKQETNDKDYIFISFIFISSTCWFNRSINCCNTVSIDEFHCIRIKCSSSY